MLCAAITALAAAAGAAAQGGMANGGAPGRMAGPPRQNSTSAAVTTAAELLAAIDAGATDVRITQHLVVPEAAGNDSSALIDNPERLRTVVVRLPSVTTRHQICCCFVWELGLRER